ncbi:DNA-binding response regulator [Actinomadura craniellae]|uniref:DNA-binding response regulator n=1 Tax=Actinomadura craniellae TaxID=2231787 RepID=A0A365HD12_9ACTN|nr:LuxR C-terminal-related transcriptional regulator [Actinomadura craniellae]RAY16806.1 DNA-binding response regulator [Actinomadura craniellae]
MPTRRQVALAARIGALAAEPDRTAAGTAAVEMLAEALSGDACAVVCRDPVGGAHRGMASHAYPGGVLDVLSGDFVRSRWFEAVLAGPLPPSISTEPGQSFRHGWIYEHHLAPAGFRDGMTGALRRNGRYVGLVHISSSRARRFDDAAQETLQAVLPVFAAIADPFAEAHRSLSAGAPHARPARAAVVRDGQVLDVPDRTRPAALADARLRQVVDDFAASAGHRLRMLWPAGGAWVRLLLARQTGLGTLVQERPCAPPYGLTERELDVLTRLAMGMTDQAIAAELMVSPRTVHSHVGHVLDRIDVRSRAEASGVAVREGLVRPLPGMLLRPGVRCFVETEAAH